MTVSACKGRREACYDYIRAKLPNHSHDIGQHLLPVPNRKRLFRALGVAEIYCPTKELLGSIDLARFEKFLRADHAQTLAKFWPDEVLPTITPSERQITSAKAPPLRQVADHASILIIWMSRDI